MNGWRAIPILGARDVAATVEYLRDALGFRVVDVHEPAGAGPVYAVLCREDAVVHVQIRRHDRPATREAHETEIYFEVSDVDALHAEYVARGVTMVRDLQNEPYGMRDFTIELPDGARLAFATPID